MIVNIHNLTFLTNEYLFAISRAEFIIEHPSFKLIMMTYLAPSVAMSTVVVNVSAAENVAVIGLVALVSTVVAM